MARRIPVTPIRVTTVCHCVNPKGKKFTVTRVRNTFTKPPGVKNKGGGGLATKAEAKGRAQGKNVKGGGKKSKSGCDCVTTRELR